MGESLLRVFVETLAMLLQGLCVLSQFGGVLVVISLIERGAIQSQFIMVVFQLVGALLQALMFVALRWPGHE